MGKRLLSIVMVSYNHALFIKESIESIIAQTYTQWELIIVDDGSSDGSLDIVGGFAKRFPEKIKVYSHEGKHNLGISASYKLGISLCQGRYIGFLEPDDIWGSENAMEKIKRLEEENVNFVYSDVQPIGEIDAILCRDLTLKSFAVLPEKILFRAFSRILVDNFVPSFSAVIAKKEVFRGIKFIWDKECAMWLDWFLWIQISLNTKFLFIPQKLVRWRLHRSSYCSEFFHRKGVIGKICFELRYRFMVFKEIIFLRPYSFLRRFILFFIFTAAFIKKIVLFVFNRF
ncbi:MAG: glycosyltransferase [Candidatus Omnitrophota bacterium]